MRIAYVIFWDAYRDSGVLRKARAFVDAARECGCQCELFIASTNSDAVEPSRFVGESEVISHPLFRRIKEHTAAALLARMAAFPILRRRLRAWEPDIIYYRLGLWMPGIVRTLRSAAPYVIEANTDNDREALLWDPLRRGLYSATKSFLPGAAAGIVCVSKEIGALYARYGKPSFVLSNGCDEEFSERPLPRRVSLAFAGSPGQPWQGTDKVVRLAKLFPEWEFHVIGEKLDSSPPNLVTHGYLGSAELRKVCAACTVGIGTLALYRKGMEEASPLKVREYLQLGLPVLIGYEDTDLEGAEYALRIGNSEDNVERDAERIRRFVEAVALGTVRVDAEDAMRRIAYVPKVRRLLGFLEGCAR